MPAPATATDFVAMVRRSRLVSEDQLAAVLRALDGNAQPESAERMATTLVRAALLTKFQARQLAQGRYKRFTIADKYQLLEHIGTGGMGAVYLCEHMLMHRLVAVKVLPVEKIANDPSALQRFHREARAVAALDHPNIVHAYDIDKFDQVHYLVMEYVDGTSLQEIVARYVMKRRKFDPVRAAHAVAQAAAGLQHAHDFGLIHRDVKPGNLLLDRVGTVKVLDLGLARFFDQRHDGLTQKFDDNCVLGTADYLSPEQATMNEVDGRADVYGLGGTLYFLLTGASPFPDGTVAQKLVAHQRQEPKPIADFRQDVPAEMIAVVRKAMAKNVEERYQSCVEFAEALEPWTSEPISQPPESEMPHLCPAVAARMELSSLGGRGSSVRMSSGVRPGLPKSGGAAGTSSSRVRSAGDTMKEPEATGRSRPITPIQAMAPVPPPSAPKSRRPLPTPPSKPILEAKTDGPKSNKPLSGAPLPPPLPVVTPTPWPLLIAVSVASFLLAVIMTGCAFLLFYK